MNNILNKEVFLGTFIKNQVKYYYITINKIDKEQDDCYITNTNSTNTKTYNIISNNKLVTWIAIGIGKLGITNF